MTATAPAVPVLDGIPYARAGREELGARVAGLRELARRRLLLDLPAQW